MKSKRDIVCFSVVLMMAGVIRAQTALPQPGVTGNLDVADRMAELPSRTDPSLPMVPWLREGFPKSLNVPIHSNIPLPDDQTLRLDTPVSAEKLAEWKERFQSGKALNYFYIDMGQKGNRFRTGPGLTGDEFVEIVESGKLPVAKFKHVDFIYGFIWQNVRRYYVAYRLSGDPYYIKQLLQYARAMDGVLANHREVFVPQGKRAEVKKQGITVDMVPHEPAGGSNLMAHAYSAMLAMEWVKAHPDDPRAADWTRQAGHNLDQVIKYMASLLGKTTDAKTGLPTNVANWLYVFKKYSPWNQCYMSFSVLTASALAMEDYQQLTNTRKHQPTIDTYLKVVSTANAVLKSDSDTCILNGKPYLFHQHGPAFLPLSGNPGYHCGGMINGHPLFYGGEDIPHSGSIAWHLLFIYENAGDRVGATDALLAGLVNALVDYVINHPVKDEKGEVFPPNQFHSPWAYPNIPEKWRNRKWYGKLHGIQEGYDAYVVWNPELRLGMRKWKVDGRRQELFVNFAKRIYQVAAKRRKNGP